MTASGILFKIFSCMFTFLLIFGGTLIYSEEEPVKLEPIEVIDVTPTHGTGLPKDKIPANIQTANSAAVDASQSLDLTEFISRNLGSVHINEAQNNPFQPDVRFRGFTASPLLGLPQGLATYQDGTRVNELFGDTVNWDVIPQSAIASINLMSGSNPLFGLNTLGGALSLKTKTGFTHPGHGVKVYGGSFTRRTAEFSSGGHNQRLSYFLSGNLFAEDGWRDFSPSEVRQLFGNIGWKENASTLDLSLTLADNELLGNGALPIDLLNTERSAVFTHPDRTENNMLMANLRGSHAWSDTLILASTVYYRRNNVETFNGDDTDFEPCEDPENEGFLCVGEDADQARIKDQFGNDVRLPENSYDDDDEDIEIDDNDDDDDAEGGFNATNNTSQTRQGGYGATLQAAFTSPIASRENQLIVGASFDRGEALFNSETELASLTPDRGTVGSGIFESESFVGVETAVQNMGIYGTNTFSITPRLHLTLS
ncbi:MAG: TonB-dependent receptor plug domain-containing protein, partial [Candidatus Poribacteria bacterium]|nr:TonB-dependent receptor plug domain-containing protein [Candidatus Poribacteria bacterium]